MQELEVPLGVRQLHITADNFDHFGTIVLAGKEPLLSLDTENEIVKPHRFAGIVFALPL